VVLLFFLETQEPTTKAEVASIKRHVEVVSKRMRPCTPGDLGVAKLMKGAMTNTQIGTPHYMPPEVWRNRPYTYNSDVWALGCVLFEMCTFTVPFEARSMEELRFKAGPSLQATSLEATSPEANTPEVQHT